MQPGSTFDLHCAEHGEQYNFLLAADRRRWRARLRRELPWLLVGSPPCTEYCLLQRNLNHPRMDPEEVRRRRAEAALLFAFALACYVFQLRGGRHFLHEHPATAASWNEPAMRRLIQDRRVGTVVADQCAYGLVTSGPEGKPMPARKPTRFASSAPAVLERLGRRCDGSHVHQPLVSGRPAAAALYPQDLCRAIVLGAEEQRRRQGFPVPPAVERLLDAGVGVFALTSEGKEELDMEVEGWVEDKTTGDEAENLEQWLGTPFVVSPVVTIHGVR